MSHAPIVDRGDCLLIGRRAMEGVRDLPYLATDQPLGPHRLVLADLADPGFPAALHALMGRLSGSGCTPFFLMMGAAGPSPSAVAQARTWRDLLRSSGWIVVEIGSGERPASGELRSLVQAWRTVLRASGLDHMKGLMAHLKGSPNLRCTLATTPPNPGFRQETYDRLAATAFENLRHTGPGTIHEVAGVFAFGWEGFEAAHLEKLLKSLWKPCGNQVEWGPLWFTDSGRPDITLLLLGHG
jgi:hypothetical protein